MKNKSIISHYFSYLNNFLNKKLPSQNLYEPISYMFQLGGKSLRPFFLLFSYKIFGGKSKKINQVAIALESLHNFSLIHDDVMDNADKRRGQLSVPKKWNKNSAILSGDVLMLKSFEVLTSINDFHQPVILKEFINTAIKICEGQQMDLDFEKKDIILKNEYFKMIEMKTAALFVFCFKVGCLLAGGNRLDVQKMKKIGLKVGMLFQMQDDYLDFFGTKKVGKKIGQDVIENKKTFLFSLVLDVATKVDIKEFTDLYNKKTLNVCFKISELLNEIKFVSVFLKLSS